jgi:hypothetical protein
MVLLLRMLLQFRQSLLGHLSTKSPAVSTRGHDQLITLERTKTVI